VAENFDSIQDVLRRRRGAAFIGRGAQLALFRDNFDLPASDPRKCFVFNVHGEGGVGKSTLLGQWRQVAQQRGAVTGYSDEHVFGAPEAMFALLDQMNAPSEVKEFCAKYSDYLKSRERLENDPEAPRELWSQVTRTGVKAGLHASKALPGVAPVVELIDGETAADAVDRVRQFLIGKVRDSKEVRLLLSPTRELAPLFVSALRKVAGGQPVVLFLDTFEQTSAFLEDWLIDVLLGEYGELPTTVAMVVAGRLPLDPNRWSEVLGLVGPVPLAPFTRAETLQFLTAQGVTDPRTAEAIMTLSGGLPLLTDMLAKSRPADAGAVGDPTDTAVERFLKWEPDTTRRRAALAGALPRQIDEDLLAAVMPDADATALFGWLTEQAFVRLHADRYRYHEVVRSPMIRWQRQRSPQRWRGDHVRLAEVYRERRDLIGTGPDWPDAAWLDSHIEFTYHRLCGLAVPQHSVMGEAVKAVSTGIAVARRWAEMIVEAGRDADDDGLRTAGLELLDAATADDSDGTLFLTVLLDSGMLDDAGRANSLLERGRKHYFADRDREAVDDCTEAVRCDPSLGKAYAVRAAAEGFLGEYDSAIRDFAEALRIDPDDVWAISRRGRTYAGMGSYDQALADFNRVIELDPGSVWVLAERGETYSLMGRHDEALADINRVIERDPEAGWAFAGRGQTYQAMGRYSEALADYDRAVALGEARTWTFASRGDTYRLMERHTEALADLDRAISLDQTYAWAIGTRGQTYQAMGRHAEALADFDRAIELQPTYDWLLTERASMYREMERYDEALADYGRAIDVNPGFAWAFTGRGETLRLLERYEEAVADYTRALELDPGSDWAVAGRAETFRLMERYDEALADFGRAIELNPAYVWAIASRGQTYQAVADYDRALAAYNAALDLNPDAAPWVLAGRGEVHHATRRYDEALADFTRAIDLDPGYASAFSGRAHTYEVMERPGDAHADFSRVIELDPDADWAFAGRGRANHETERYDEALADFSRAIELDPAYDFALSGRAETYHAMERYAEALADLNRAIAVNPDSGGAFAGRGDTLRLLGRHDEALADLTRAVELDPAHAWALAHRGETLRELGRCDEALADLDRAIGLDPGEPEYFRFRARVNRDLGRTADADADAERASRTADADADAERASRPPAIPGRGDDR
jgi:tetratricopeptide (TPR) repeat protein